MACLVSMINEELTQGLNQVDINARVRNIRSLREKSEDPERLALRERLFEQGIDWTDLNYHKTPRVLATIYDIMAGAQVEIIANIYAIYFF